MWPDETVADELGRAANALRDELRRTQRAIAAVVEQDRAAAARTGTESERARVRTRIEFYLERVTEAPEAGRPLRDRLAEANGRVAALEEDLRQDTVQEMLASNMSVLSGEMTQAGRELELEYGRFPLRLDLSRLTVVADTTEGPIPMTRMGSGENWVAYHLIAHLALHAWFVRRKRPVPRFLFLDQATQVYYPPERDAEGRLDMLKDEDRIAVRRMFALIFRVVEELSPNLQVIITDHADLDDQRFQDAIVERWRGGAKLVPAAWLPADLGE